jgi:hypothetical protein
MDKTKTESTIIVKSTWPTPQDYNEAVQNLEANCKDAELQQGTVEHNALGLPMPRSGAFASVYKVIMDRQVCAIRCFLRELDDAEERYRCISNFVQNDDLSYTVGFDFQREGIRVGARWVPLLKMEWVEGETFDNYLNKRKGKISDKLAQKFLEMCNQLQAAGIAHGDLQHGNIIMRDDEFYLVDYDGMFVPGLEQHHSTEIGHRNYQHPKRDRTHFGVYLDNFSAWVIYTSLRALAFDENLYNDLGAGEDCLLFRKTDFEDPNHSPAFAALERCADKEIAALAKYVRYLLFHNAPDTVPPLTHAPPQVNLPPIDPSVSERRALPTLVVGEPVQPHALELLQSDEPSDLLKTSAQVAAERAALMVHASSRSRSAPAVSGHSAAQALATTGSVEAELFHVSPRPVFYEGDKAGLSIMTGPLLFIKATLLAMPFLMVSSQLAIYIWLLAILFMVITKGLGEVPSYESREDFNLLSRGIATRARIIKVHKMDAGTYLFKYIFLNSHSKKVVEQWQNVTSSELTQIGNEFTVLYDPHTNKSLIYRLAKGKVRASQ